MLPPLIFPVLTISTILTCVVALYFGFPNLDADYALTFSATQLAQIFASLGAMIVAALSPFPAELVAIANGMIYGPITGFALTWIGGLIGASIGYFAAQIFGRRLATRLIGTERTKNLDGWIKQHGIYVLLLARLIPFVPFFVLNYGAALVGIRFSIYLAITAIGIIPMTVLSVVLGDRVKDYDWQIAGIIAVLCLAVFCAVFWFRRLGALKQ